MKKSTLLGLALVPILVANGLVFSLHSAFASDREHRKGAGYEMGMHYLGTVINRGMEVVIGANLVMLAQMRMAPGLNQEVIGRGRSLMEQGKKALQQIQSDPVSQALQKGSGRDAPIMKYAHDLAGAMLEAADTLEEIKLDKIDPDTRTLHYFNMLINQALGMASEGSGLIMAGQTGVSPAMDEKSLERGETMLRDARSLVIQVMGSGEMTRMHSREAGQMPAMGATHELAMVVLKVLDLLDELP